MTTKTKTEKPNKLNKTIFDAYEKAINNRIKIFKPDLFISKSHSTVIFYR